jgi:hypothetical protein
MEEFDNGVDVVVKIDAKTIFDISGCCHRMIVCWLYYK